MKTRTTIAGVDLLRLLERNGWIQFMYYRILHDLIKVIYIMKVFQVLKFCYLQKKSFEVLIVVSLVTIIWSSVRHDAICLKTHEFFFLLVVSLLLYMFEKFWARRTPLNYQKKNSGVMKFTVCVAKKEKKYCVCVYVDLWSIIYNYIYFSSKLFYTNLWNWCSNICIWYFHQNVNNYLYIYIYMAFYVWDNQIMY